MKAILWIILLKHNGNSFAFLLISLMVFNFKTNLFSYIGLGFVYLFLNIATYYFGLFSKWKQFAIYLLAIIICYKLTTFFQ